jgi:hypothetical protein
LKALLEELGIDMEKTHELKSLQTPLLPHHPSLRALRRGMDFLTNFAVNSATQAKTPRSVKPRPLCAGPARCAMPAATTSASQRRRAAASGRDRATQAPDKGPRRSRGGAGALLCCHFARG